MKAVKVDGQWMAQTNGFDVKSGLSTLPLDGNDEEDDNEDDIAPHHTTFQAPVLHILPKVLHSLKIITISSTDALIHLRPPLMILVRCFIKCKFNKMQYKPNKIQAQLAMMQAQQNAFMLTSTLTSLHCLLWSFS